MVSEYQSATFECEVSFDDAVVTWYKGKVELRESHKYSFRNEGRCHYMTIHNVTADDEGKVNSSFILCPLFLISHVTAESSREFDALFISGVYSVIARLEPRGEARSTAELYLTTKGQYKLFPGF